MWHTRTFMLSVTWLTLTFGTEPDTESCCRQHGVTNTCVHKFCRVNHPPYDGSAESNVLLDFMRSFNECNMFLPAISTCLTDGRNNTECCRGGRHADSASCFDMCDGTASAFNEGYWESKKQYEPCIQLNLPTIYACYRDGYTNGPSQPRQLSVNVMDAYRARVTWSAPSLNTDLVDSYVIDLKAQAHNVEHTVRRTQTTAIELTDLRPDTKYNLTVTAVCADGHRSQPTTTTTFVTQGVRPVLVPYRARVHAALNTAETLVCHVQVPGWQHKHVQVKWEKQNAVTNDFDVLHNHDGHTKYDLTAYIAAAHQQPRSYVSALRIMDISLRDFGSYQCTATNKFGKGVGQVTLAPVITDEIPAAPPNTTDCCVRAGVQSQCLSSCSDSNTTLPSQACYIDEQKILACSVAGTNRGACCLRRKVPSHCLSFCDGSEPQHDLTNPSERHTPLQCLQYTTHIFACILEGGRNLPDAPIGLRVASQSSSVAVIRWEPAARARRYHVYHRQHGETSWNAQSLTSTEVQLTNLVNDKAHEIVVVAANDSGRSGASRTLRLFTGRAPRDVSVVPYDPDDVSERYRAQQRLRGAATGRLMEEHFGSH